MLGLNVNKTTSMLAKLADNALQSYASMHKSNPYILSLAVAEANRRKELRASRGAQSAPQPQPKVADVAIANMASSPEEQGYGALPEQRGIGALPANNMRMMADGGIVGYDDQEPVQMMSRGGRADMYGDGPSMFDSALDQEKVTNPVERAFLKAIHVQESGGKSSAKTSNQNAHGAMQVIPSTFKAMADPGMDINNPLDNMRAGIRFGRQGFRAAGGDPVLAGAFYYGGPGGMRKLQRGVTVSDPKNPKAPNTRQYGESVARRMQQLLGNTQAKPQRPAPTFIEPPAREIPPMLFAAAPQSDGIPSHSEAPIGDVRMGQHAGIEDDTRALAAQQAMAAQQSAQMMAGGGVARFAGGGIDDLDPKKLRERAEKRLRLEQLREGRLIPQGPYSPLPSQAASPSASSIRSVNPAGVAGYGLGLYHGDLNEGEAAELERRRAMGPTLDAQVQGETFDPATSRSMLNRAEQSARTNPAVYGAPNTATGSDSGGAGTGTSGGADLPSMPSMPGMDLAGMYSSAMESARNINNPFATDIEAVGKEKIKASEENLAGLEAFHKKFEDVFKARRDRLGTREEEVGKLQDEAGRMALVNFGLAMAKTPGKGLSGLLSGLTAGADAGSKEYAKGMDKFRAAQEKLNDAKDRLEELEANRGEMSARELHKARNDIRATTISAREDMIKSNMDMYKLNRDDAQKMFTAQVQYGIAQLEQGGAFARTKLSTDATLQTPERMAYMSALEKTKTKANPKGDPAAAYQSIVAMKREPVSMEKLRGDWLDMAKKMQIQADYPNIKTFEDYVTVFGGGAGGGGGGDGLRVVGVR